MKKPVKQILFWTPRVAGILFILFISIFALDVFEQGYSFWETLLALFMHLLPSIGLAIAVAWRGAGNGSARPFSVDLPSGILR